MASWYHVETTTEDGTTWRTTQPLPVLADVAKYVAEAHPDAVHIVVQRFEDDGQ